MVTRKILKQELNHALKEQTRGLMAVLETMMHQLEGTKESMEAGVEAKQAIKSDINPRLEKLEEQVGL